VSILYISYDGVLEPLGQSQVLAYLRCLAVNQRVHLISFEKKEDWTNLRDRLRLAGDLSEAGIIWHPMRYHKRPSLLATSWDIFCGVAVGLWIVIRYRLNIVHARSYVPCVIALALKRLVGVKYIFDMRGFWADERVDGGLWIRNGKMYSVAKWFEKRFLLSADHVVVLSHAAIRELASFDYLVARLPPTTVIPTCADLTSFMPRGNERVRSRFVLGYVGSVGTWYLFDQVVACFSELLRMRPDSQFLIVNRSEHAIIQAGLSAAGIPSTAVELISAAHVDMPLHICRMDAGVFFIKPVFSKKASAPTKLAEFLGCGIPCMGNVGVGDMAEILENERVGVALSSFTDASICAGLQQLLLLADDPNTRARCVATAHKHFSLDEGVERYRRIYEQLAG
jgi:glycosyltransferase involved in cell wall biosynthesis